MTKRALRTSLHAAAWLLVAPALVLAAGNDEATIRQILGYKPVLAGAAEYDTPADAKAIAACTLEILKSPPGFLVRDGQGKTLRRFVVAVPDPKKAKVNQWGYYQDGFEVYREASLDPDTSVDEARWMNAGGTRVAAVSGNKVTSWKRISAEEASKVLVQALVANDVALLETVMATPEELSALGVPEAEVGRAGESAKGRAEAFAALRKSLAGWNAQTAWLRFDATMPHVIPMDSAAGLKGDLTLYENAVILAGQPGGGAVDKTSFLQSGELVKVGETWKFVDLPRAINPTVNTPVVALAGGIRAAVFREVAGPGDAGNPQQEAAIKALSQFDNENAAVLAGADQKAIARYYVDRARHLRAVEKETKKAEEALSYVKQEIDCIANAYQTGQYPQGLKILNDIEGEKKPQSSYAAFRRINAEFALEQQNQGNPVAATNHWMKEMKAFLTAFPKSDEEPEVLFQLASTNEFSGEEPEARTYYGQLVADYPESPAGKKAAGALRRLDSVGKPIAVRGASADGKTIDSAQFKGKVVLVAFWATTVPASRKDMPEIAKLYEKNKGKGFEVVSVCLDNDPASLAAYLKENPLPWPTIFEGNGLESRLAAEFGIIALPTMMLVDADGNVIHRAVRNAADLDIQLEKALAGRSAGVANRAGN